MKESDIRNKETFNRYLELVRRETGLYFKDKKDFKIVPCVSCGSEKFEVQFEKTNFTYVLCADCGTLYANPRPLHKDLLKFYKDSKSTVFWVNEFFLPTLESRREKIFRPRAEFVARKLWVPGMRVLGDIGAGFGLFLEETKKILPEITAVAIEPSSEMARICRDKGFETIEKAIEDVNGMEEKFDILTSFELLEHLFQPRALLRKAYGMLKPRGLFLLTSLNCEGFDIQLLWERSKNIYPPHHINFFNPRSIKKSLEDNGFCVKEISTPGKLDWNIVENAIHDGAGSQERFWRNFAINTSDKAKEELQSFLAKNNLSSHMMVLAGRE